MKLKRNKKGQLGMNLVIGVALAFLVITVIAVSIILTSQTLQNAAEDIETGQRYSVTNLTTAVYLNTTGFYIPEATTVTNFNSPVLIAFQNVSDGATVLAGNGTVSSAGLVKNATSSFPTTYSVWLAGYVYYGASNNSDRITGNVSSGLVDFFGNTTTIFSILVVVVIILAIAIIVGAVKGFGSSGRKIGEGMSGSSESL